MLMAPSPADRFFSGFYRHREPETAAAALQMFLDNPQNNARRVARMFVRAIQVDDNIQHAFRDLASTRPDLAQRIDGLLQTAASPAFPNPATAPLKAPEDLDFQWAEFLLTGDAAPVERIVSVLQRPDRTLQALATWRGQKARMPWTRRARSNTEAQLLALGFQLDDASPTLGNILDLDLATWKRMADGNPMQDILPFRVDDAHINHLMMKGSACWSLQSNAVIHPVVQARYGRLDAARLPRFA